MRLTPSRVLVAAFSTALAASACGGGSSTPANVAGSYTLNITNGANGCQLANYTEGKSTSGTMLTVTQDATDTRQVVGKVEGIVGGLLQLGIGSSTFQGTVDGNAIDMKIVGAGPTTTGGCMSTPTVRAQASVVTDTITGTLQWHYITNGSADCGVQVSCSTIMTFNGTRPPSATP